MFVESMNEYVEILTGHVYDNDKVVTYKWLSKELEVHVNISKQVLWEFWQKHKEENNIECTVMLIGNLKSGGMRVEVVRESNLSTAKKKFSDIKSEHIYSVQKSIPDLESLAMCDKGDIRFSAIKCKESIERSDEELAILRWGTLLKDCPVPIQGDKLKPKDKPKEVQASKSPEHKEASKKSLNKKTTPTSQKTGFNNLFTKVPNKEMNGNKSPSNSTSTKRESTQISVGQQSSSSKESESTTTMKKDKKSFESFFEKNASVAKDIHSQSSVPKEEQINSNIKNNTKDNKKTQVISTKEKTASVAKDIHSQSSVPKEEQINTNIKNNTKDNKKTQVISTKSSSSNQSTEKARGKKRNRSKESNHIIKKRKRIIVNDDLSDSQNEDEDEEMRSEPEPEPESEPEQELEIIQDKKEQSPPPRVIDNKGRARILKMVDKTYEEDGFLVTKKVHVYESCSEDETDVKTQVAKKQESTSEPKVQAKKKQTTLTNFFKKS